MAEARRPANSEERALVRWLLEHAATDSVVAETLGSTVDELEVAERCDCGCPSVDFIREGQGAGAQILAEAMGTALDGLPLELLLWGRDGKISGLEVYNYDGGTWFPLPRPDHLQPVTTAV